MSLFKKAVEGRSAGFMAMRCGFAVVIGMAIVTIVSMGLIVISDADEPAPEMAFHTIRFPEDEAMLKDLSSRILQQAQAREDEGIASLADIQPAAGGDVQEPAEDVPAAAE